MKRFKLIALILAFTAFAMLSAAAFADESRNAEEGTIPDKGDEDYWNIDFSDDPNIFILPNPNTKDTSADDDIEPSNDRNDWNDDWNNIIDYDMNELIGIGKFDRDTAEMLLFLRGKISLSVLRIVHGYFTWEELEEIAANGY